MERLAARPKYSRGAKVRVITRGAVVDPELKKYENMRGTVVNSKEVVGYVLQMGLPDNLKVHRLFCLPTRSS